MPPHHLANPALQPATTGPDLSFCQKSLSSLSPNPPTLVCLSRRRQEFVQNSQQMCQIGKFTGAPSMRLPSHLFTTIFLLQDSSGAFHIAYLSDVTNCICQIAEHNFDGTKTRLIHHFSVKVHKCLRKLRKWNENVSAVPKVCS